jgi:hypothetical protein
VIPKLAKFVFDKARDGGGIYFGALEFLKENSVVDMMRHTLCGFYSSK